MADTQDHYKVGDQVHLSAGGDPGTVIDIEYTTGRTPLYRLRPADGDPPYWQEEEALDHFNTPKAS